MIREVRGTAMGTEVHLAADRVDAERLEAALARLQEWDRRWTRFSPDSELAAINRAGGWPCIVASDTAALVDAAVTAWHSTGHRFDPSVHDAVVAAGYDRTFADGPGPTTEPTPAPGLGDVDVDLATGTVLAPAGVRLDLGGIGKGFAADRLVAELLADGADQVAVSIGGDARVVGHPEAGWPMGAEGWDEPVAWLRDGGFCFSSTAKRRWGTPTGERHHLIDPRTGESTTSGIRHVAVAAADATTAEVFATAAIVAGRAEAVGFLTDAGLDGFVVTDEDSVHRFGAWPANPSIFGAPADGSRCE